MTEELSLPPGTFPALKSLGLESKHLLKLMRQGTLRPDTGARGPYFKLRFRFEGRPVVRYVGSRMAFVEQVRTELEALRQPLKKRRNRRRLLQHGRRCLKETRGCLQPVLKERGLHFHGHQIRRNKNAEQSTDKKDSVLKLNLGRMVMDDRKKLFEQLPANGGAKAAPPDAITARYRKRLDDVVESGVGCDDARQAIVRCAMAQLLGVSAVITSNIENDLRERPMSIRELRKHVVPVLQCVNALAKRGTQCAQLDREYDPTPGDAGERRASLPYIEPEET